MQYIANTLFMPHTGWQTVIQPAINLSAKMLRSKKFHSMFCSSETQSLHL